ncbi:MAG: hypothetical protein AABX01_00585 [Candidatus Micrarchaeota archaeon]
MPIVIEAMIKRGQITQGQAEQISRLFLYEPSSHAFEGGHQHPIDELGIRTQKIQGTKNRKPLYHKNEELHQAIDRGVKLGLLIAKYRTIVRPKHPPKRVGTAVIVNDEHYANLKAFALKHVFGNKPAKRG